MNKDIEQIQAIVEKESIFVEKLTSQISSVIVGQNLTGAVFDNCDLEGAWIEDIEGRRYPPKAVVGLAAGKITGQTLGPYDFKGVVADEY